MSVLSIQFSSAKSGSKMLRFLTHDNNSLPCLIKSSFFILSTMFVTILQTPKDRKIKLMFTYIYKKAWEFSPSLVPHLEAFALPDTVERATRKPTPDMNVMPIRRHIYLYADRKDMHITHPVGHPLLPCS